ncbi:hypothetical protein V8E52_010734, partial [Russula decolorans]
LIKRPPPFLNDDGDDDDDDDDDEVPCESHDRSSSARRVQRLLDGNPTAFAAPNPTTSMTSSGLTFCYNEDKTKTLIHTAMPGYVNTPELSAGRGGELSQGLPANGPYKSFFRAGFGSESPASASNHQNTDAAAAPALIYMSLLRLLSRPRRSPPAVSAIASPQPTPTPAPAPTPTSVPTSKKRSRTLSPLIASASPASSVERSDPISASRSSPVASTTNASSSSLQSHIPIIIDPRVILERDQAPLEMTNKGRHFLPKHQAMGMARLASSDTSTVYCRRVVNCQNGPAPSSTNRNMRCRRTKTRTGRQVRTKWVPFRRHRPHLPTTSVTITHRVITSLLTSTLGFPAQAIYP